MELFWITTFILTIGTATVIVFLLGCFVMRPAVFHTLIDGIKHSLEDCGFHLKSRGYRVELYKLEPVEEGDLCDNCVEKLDNPPMDIADWMKEGFPKNPPPFSKCDGHCKCQLILVQKKYTNK